ncbi:26901_t:CDS:1, partial [Dentiscutata erythropus]
LRSEIQERSYEEIMDAYRNKLTNLNISLCRECLLLIKLEERDYCNSCQPE